MKNRQLATALLLLSLFTSSYAQDGPAPQRPQPIPDSVHGPLIAGELEATLEALEDIKGTKAKKDGTWQYLTALTLARADRTGEAIELLVSVEADHPTGPWRSKARFFRSELLGELGRHAEAQELLDEEAIHLRSFSRRAELAEVCFKVADDLSETDPLGLVDSGMISNMEHVQKVLEEILELDVAPEVQLRVYEYSARVMSRVDNAVAVLSALNLWKETAAGMLAQAENPALELRLLETRFSECVQLAPMGTDDANSTLEIFSQDLKTDSSAALLGERLRSMQGDVEVLRATAKTASQSNGNMNGRIQAIAILESFLVNHPGHLQCTQAAYDIGELQEAGLQSDQAVQAYRSFLARPALPNTEARELLALNVELRMAATWRLGQLLRGIGEYDDAIASFQRYITRFPTGPKWSDAQQAIVDVQYQIGSSYFEEGEFASARSSWFEFMAENPLSPLSLEASVRVADSFLAEAIALDVDTRSDEAVALLHRAIDAFDSVVKKNPRTDEASQSLLEMGKIFEDRLGELASAIEIFQLCDFGGGQFTARLRLASMLEESLSVRTLGTIRSDEAPSIQLTTRNLDEVTIELYALDLEDYFRRHKTHRSVENLDLDLIQADQSFTHKPSVTADHQRLVENIQLPVDSQGVWVVTVASGMHRATTLVMVSDIDLIIESNDREVVVFAQDMVKNEPAPGTRLVLLLAPEPGATEATVIEAETGKDGLAHVTFPHPSASLAVLGIRGASRASEGLELDTLVSKAMITPTAFLYTERSTYLPGETVYWRGVFRTSDKQGNFVFQAGREYDIAVLSGNGRMLAAATQKLSTFGTLHGEIPLARGADTGRYTVRITDPKDKSLNHTLSFLVSQFEVPKARLVATPRRTAILRGDGVWIDLLATYSHGAPIPMTPIVVTRIHEDIVVHEELTTDSEGRAAFHLEGSQTLDGRQILFQFGLTEENASTELVTYISTQSYQASLATDSELFLAGETFAVNLTTTGIDGKPTGRDMSLRVLRHEVDARGKTHEVLATEMPISTKAGSEPGKGSIELRLELGGNYTLRVEGLDENGNPIQTSSVIFLSDKNDDVRLRFLPERIHYEVGETASLRLHNRTDARLALVLIEGGGILDYSIQELAQGDNTVDFGINSAHFSRVYASVSLMDGNKFHRVVQHLNVSRELLLEINTSSEEVLPGQPAEVTVTTTDGLGNPTPAEFSLALVDDVYFDLYPDRTGDISTLFKSSKVRARGLRASTTCEFSYEGVTDTISVAILEELQREAKSKAYDRRLSDAQDRLGWLSDKSSENSDSPFDSDDSPDVFSADAGRSVAPSSPGALNDVIGIGGGAGGRFGRRAGGRKNLAEAAGNISAMESRDAALESATRYWNPNAATGEDGTLTLTIPMPQQGGTWRLLSRGVGEDTRVGQDLVRIRTHAPLLVELLTPPAVRSGDRFEVRARVHYAGGQGSTAYLSLGVGGVLEPEVRQRAIALDGAGSHTVSFGELVAGEMTGILRLDLAATLDAGPTDPDSGSGASASKTLEVRPFGVVLHATDGGHLADRMDLGLQLPGTGGHSDVALELFVGGGVGPELISAALGRSSFGTTRSPTAENRANTAGDLLGVISVMEWLRESDPGSSDLNALAKRARHLVDSLVASQEATGQWSWTSKEKGYLLSPMQPARGQFGPAHSGELETTVLALLALQKASKSIPVPDSVLDAGASVLQGMFSSLSGSAHEQKAMALHGLSVMGAADFADVNRLYRARAGLSPAALAHLVLTLVELDRMGMAAELASSLSALAVPTPFPTPRCGWPTSAGIGINTSWSRDPNYMNGLSLWAIARSQPNSPQLALGAEGLLASAPWGAGRTTGLVLAALTAYGSDALVEQGGFEVDVTLEGDEPIRLQVLRGAAGASLVLDLPDLPQGSVQGLRLELVGSARTGEDSFAPTFHAILSGLSSAEEGLSTPFMLEPKVVYQSVAPIHHGVSVDTGFDIVSPNGQGGLSERWINTVDNLPRGKRCKVAIALVDSAEAESGKPATSYPNFLELEVPLPPGTAVVPGTLTGTLENYSEVRGGLLLTLQAGVIEHFVEFELIGTVEGAYHLPPAVLRATTDPGRVGLGTSSSLNVLAMGELSPDGYRRTPDELFDLGQKLFYELNFDEAHIHLSSLFQKYDGLLSRQAQSVSASMLLDLSIQRGDSEETVRFFESLKEYDPDMFLTLEEVLAIGRSYRDMGEHERATTMFMATIAETFNRDMRVAGVLETYGPFLSKSKVLDRLWREYPDLSAVVATRLSHADALLTKAESAHLDPDLRAAGLGQVSIIMDSIMVLREFMALYPEHVLSPSAGLNLVSAYLELEDYKHVAELSGRLAERFPAPKIRDDFRYTRAVASWYEGRPTDAVSLLQGIADAVYSDERGAESKSVNHNLALYLLGQIYHAAGDLDLASKFYQRVMAYFPDAKDLYLELEESRLELDEVTAARPGASIELPLRFKGVREVELLLYPVDLMTLYLRDGDLESVAKVNLTGIAPVAKETFRLKPKRGLEVGSTKLELPKLETGAYLAMARSEGLFASGLILVTDLELLVREDATQGQVRAQVTRVGQEGYLADVDIRVVGSDDGHFQTGKTDRRGLFATSGINGTATVIARLGAREYAFHRGITPMGSSREAAGLEALGYTGAADFKATGESFFGNVLGQNRQEQGSRMEELQSNMKRTSKGVQVQSLP
jgi:hypothetical protein